MADKPIRVYLKDHHWGTKKGTRTIKVIIIIDSDYIWMEITVSGRYDPTMPTTKELKRRREQFLEEQKKKEL